jgi:signal transduction histidine kinase
VTAPLATAASVASRIERGDLEARVSDVGPPEVRELARNMNSMTARINDMLRAEREFAANASHQLRTPLTALRLSLEEAIEGDDPREEAAHALQQADRLGQVMESLLRLGQVRERAADAVDLAEVARGYGDLAGSGPPVRVTGAGMARGDPERVRQVVANLIDNAMRFAHSRIVVSIEPANGRMTLRVDDDGPGIPDDDLSRVFDRFYRGGSPVGAGSGLGLAVARELVRADGGTIRADASPLGGARFVVEWPSASTSTRRRGPD